MAQIGGTAHLKINEASYTVSIEEGCTISLQNNKRDAVIGSDGIAHYTEVPMADKISGTLLLVPGLNPMVITEAENATISLVMNNGRTALLSQAFFSGETTVNSKNGTMTFEFTGQGRWL